MQNKLILVDDEMLFREGMKRILTEFADFEIIQEASNGEEFLKAFDQDHLPDLILLDLSMPEMDGIETLSRIMEISPSIKVAILSSHYDPGLIVKLIEMGAASFFAKNTEPEELIEGVSNIILRGFHYTNYIIQLLRNKMVHGYVGNESESILSDREKEVLRKLCEQKTAKEIASELYISPRTVEGHRNKLLEKTNSKNIAGLIIYAVEHNLFKVKMKQFDLN